MAFAFPTPRFLGAGAPRVALAAAAFAALVAGRLAGVAGFSGPSELFFWSFGFGFLLVSVRGIAA